MKKHAIRVVAVAGLAALAGGGIMVVEVLLLNHAFGLAALFGLGAVGIVFATALLLGVPLYYCHVRFREQVRSWLGVYLLVGAVGSVLVMIIVFPFALELVRYNYQLIVLPGLIGLGSSFVAWIAVSFGRLQIGRVPPDTTMQRTDERPAADRGR